MKHIVLSIFLLAGINTFAQNDSLLFKKDFEKELQPLKTDIQALKAENNRLKTEIGKLKTQLFDTDKRIESLQTQTQANNDAINQTAQELGVIINETQTMTEKQIADVDKSLGKTKLWAIIGILFAVIVSGIVYLLLRRKQQSDKTDIVAQLSQTKQSIDEKLVNEFAKVADSLEALSQMSKPLQTAEPDHSLALKVASEITLIERNISHMNKETKGLKPLIRAIERLKDNLLSKGYEMPELLGKPFVEGMKITIVTTIPDENLKKGIDVITKIIKPQVNFNEKLIQMAQVEVSVGIN